VQVIAIGAPDGVHPSVHRVGRTLDEVLTAVAGLLADDVVVATRDDQARAVARSARLVLGPERVGLLHVDAPVTAWAVLLAGISTEGLTASAAQAVATEVLARTATRALVSSVAGLDRPAPTFRQHAGSYLPRTAFVVDPVRGTVGRFSGRLGLPDGGDLLVVSRSARPVVPVDDGDLLSRDPDTTLTGALPGWPAARWFEASTVVGALSSAVAAAVSASYRWGACDVCGRAVAGACIFCGVTDRRARLPRPDLLGPGLPGPERTDARRPNLPDSQGVIS
jgi:hypothetical protein